MGVAVLRSTESEPWMRPKPSNLRTGEFSSRSLEPSNNNRRSRFNQGAQRASSQRGSNDMRALLLVLLASVVAVPSVWAQIPLPSSVPVDDVIAKIIARETEE